MKLLDHNKNDPYAFDLVRIVPFSEVLAARYSEASKMIDSTLFLIMKFTQDGKSSELL